VPGARSVERTFDVPVRVVDRPASFELKGVEPPAVKITLAGLSREFYLIGSRNLAVTIDGSRLSPGRSRVAVDDKDLRYPKALEVLRVKPRKVSLVVETRAEAKKAS